ncbi:Inorganic pyrophosphatase ttm2 [Turnera subulata]|uniref:Inorganic pyrophosphatase ttm2 n=1 Tax=Turnera subulata TaxID=218843 RepID=A0A9Q0JG88_9ROSI|nr:Inorganic pyrophosphatase ttm2 [Turnera subulata]
MDQDVSGADSHPKRQGLLKDQVRLFKRKSSDRYEIVPIQDPLSFEKGFFAVIRACQLLAQKNDGMILVGLAGPSGAGKTIFTDKILSFMPSVAVISMDNYNDSSRIIDGNFDDPRLTDYETLLKNVHDLKAGKAVQVPIYDFKSSTRTGYRTLEVPTSRIVIIEGIYALSEKLRPLLDLRISVTGGVHFDLVKRVLRDIQRAGQEPEEIIQQISETVYPMYKAFIEPDLKTAHIKITNKFNPFSGFQTPTYILKSARKVTADNIKAVFPEHKETTEQIYDIYLLPPGEDPESCQSYLRMRNKDGKYNLMFEEWVADAPFIISPRITFEVSVRLLSGLMALGYTIATILKRSSHVFSFDRVCVKIDCGISRSFTTQRDNNLSKMTSLASNQRFDDRNQESAAVLANQGAITQLSEQISSLNDRMDEFTSCVEELISKLPTKGNSPSQQNMAHQAEACNGSAPTSYFISGLGNGSLTGAKMHSSSSSSQLAKDSNLMEEISGIARGQRQVIHQLDALSSFLREGLGERSRQIQAERKRKEDRQVVLAVAGVTLSCLGLCIIAGSRS